MDVVERLEKRLVDFEKARDTLIGYQNGSVALPSSFWDLEEIVAMQQKIVDAIFGEITTYATALERINELPADLSDKISRINQMC
jgi:hypothetical protein